jgi:hypothetical protein
VAKLNPTASQSDRTLCEVPGFIRESPKIEIGIDKLRNSADKKGAVLASA